ncbi:MerR family DNA-binding transcriptional regulator [Aureimonas sp. AU4]|uniref:MerR family transcriptional regulator n=1 Tax=Aureimonas sp. AU4 TaxID=1638163 RepID=UPI0009EC224A|nr:MerR family DNA-binding transcriptional regulator [Aureimonas sp. AU4]
MTERTDLERADEEGFRVGIEELLGLSVRSDGDGERTVFKIGDLAREFGVTLRTLRFYEDRGLLSPERRGTTRLYSRRDRMRLRLVLICKILGFSLTEAKQIIEIYYQPNGERKQIEFALSRMEEQRKILEEQEREIQESLHAMEVTMSFVRGREKRGSA